MSDPYIGEIRIWANTYNPIGWAYCSGTTLSVLQNQALYAVIGVSFGGTFGSNFKLPNLCNRAPIGKGAASGLTTRVYATACGETSHTLTGSEMAAHIHTMYANVEIAKETTPDPEALLSLAYNPSTSKAYKIYKSATTTPAPTLVAMSPNTMAWLGLGASHNNMQPYIAMIYCIATVGVFPIAE
jgi:microcystin-dependent protein